MKRTRCPLCGDWLWIANELAARRKHASRPVAPGVVQIVRAAPPRPDEGVMCAGCGTLFPLCPSVHATTTKTRCTCGAWFDQGRPLGVHIEGSTVMVELFEAAIIDDQETIRRAA